MEIKKNKVMIIGIVVLTIVLITGVSFAIWQITLQQESTNVITTGCFKIEFQDKNPIGLENAYPITDNEGMGLTPYEFTITNTCDSYASYQINLEILEDTTLENLDYIKVMLDEEKTILTNNESVTKTLEGATKSFKLETGYLDANVSKTFSLRLWMDENTPTKEEFMNKTFQSKITIISTFETNFDRESPESFIEVTNLSNKIKVDASNSLDNGSVKYYYYSLDGENFVKTKESEYTFEVGNLSYGKGTETIKTLADSLEYEYTAYVKTEDEYGNMSEVVSEKVLSGFAYDETVDNNLRYIGANPNNYIDIGDRDADGNIILWRIIGSMNNIKTNEEDEVGESRLKLIRAESIGNYSWDTSDSSINWGYGINEWSQADANLLLNDYYYNSKINQKCYNGQSNAITNCDFSSIGLSENSKNLVEEVVWNLGTNGSKDYTSSSNGLASHFYEYERSNNTGKICSGGATCNDNVVRTTIWKGYIGLMYPSDYGYATSGGSTTNRETCLNTALYNWGNSNISNCKDNNWFYNSGQTQWTLISYARSSHAASSFTVRSTGLLGYDNEYLQISLSPTLYLKSNVRIIDGDGTTLNPFIVSLTE